jgi:hypothetical protein
VGPKIFPIRLLNNDPLPDWVGGGGTTVFDESGMLPLPLAVRRISCETSVEGGGAMMVGEGKFSLGLRVAACSGADTGGGITAALVICTGEREISRLTPPGAGGITLAASAEVERALSRATLGAGATTEELSDGAVTRRSRETLGAGGIATGARAGATSRVLPEIFGAGGISVALRLGAMSG